MATKNTLYIGVASLAILAATVAFAQEASNSDPALRNASPDSTFIESAASGGLSEVKMGQLAEQKASNEEVKKFGEWIVNDHSKTNEELHEIAARENISLANGLTQKDQATYDRLSKLSGGEFDRAYMREMIADHKKDISDFKREAKLGNNLDAKSFASTTLPTLEDHLKQARMVHIGRQESFIDKNGNPVP